MSNTKYTWTINDTKIICLCYLLNLHPKIALIILPHIKLSSIQMKYHNCKYLKLGMGLSNVSKLHKQVWDTLN
jgi:hypothetical protein